MEFKDFSLEPATSTFAFHFISISAARLECLAERDFNGDEEGGHFYVRDSVQIDAQQIYSTSASPSLQYSRKKRQRDD